MYKKLKLTMILIMVTGVGADLFLDYKESDFTLYLPILSAMNVAIGLVVIGIEINQTKIFGQRSCIAEENRQTVFRNMPCPLMTISPQYEILMMNNEGGALTGYQEKDVVGKRCFDIFGNGEICEGCLVPEAILRKVVCRSTKKVRKINGATKFTEQTVIPIFNPDGSIKYILETALDITKAEELTEINNRMFVETVSSFAELIGSRDYSTGAHSKRVQEIAIKIGKKLGLPTATIEEISIAAILHDIGKIGIPEDILNKRGKLTTVEYDIIKRHCQIGYDALIKVESLRQIAEYVRCHHEAYDGSGYPRGIKGDSIPLVARILSVADVFEAITANRVYREAMSLDKAIHIMVDGRNTKFDPVILDAFIECISTNQTLVEDKQVAS